MKSLLLLAAGLLVPLFIALASLSRVPEGDVDINVRTVPWRTQAGRLQAAVPMGQGFRPAFDGLRRIDVALVAQGEIQGAVLGLVLRKDSPEGDVLRRVPASELPSSRGWGRFEFDPIEDSAGQAFWWQIELPAETSQSPYSPWIRYHGQIGIDMGWGNRILPGHVIEGKLANGDPESPRSGTFPRVPQPSLTAVSFAVDSFLPQLGPVGLELWGPHQEAFEDTPLRQVTLRASAEVHGGYAFFAFEPILDSRWSDISYRLTLNPEARFVGTDAGPSRLTWHGKRDAKPGLLALTRGADQYQDRSLIFRCSSSPSMGQRLAQLRARAGPGFLLAGMLWLLGGALMASVFRKSQEA